MNGIEHPQNSLRLNAVAISVVLAFCGIFGCESEPPPSGLEEWLQAEQEKAPDKNAVLDRDVSKPVPSATGPHPRAVVPESNFEFGQMRVGTRMTHEFRILNEGEAPLELVAGHPTCKCTQFAVGPAEVPPGESATLIVEWHGKFETTTFQHGGKVYTNDPENQILRFNVGGTVDATVVTQPEGVWNAGDVPGEDPIRFEGTVVSRFLPELTISALTNDSEFVSAEYEPLTESELSSIEAQSGWRIRVTVQPTFPVGQLDDTLKLTVAELEDPLEIPVIARRLGDIRFIPMKGTTLQSDTRTLHLGQFPVSRGRTGELMLMVNSEVFPDELKLLDVDSSPKTLKITLEPFGKPNAVSARYKLKIEVPAGGLRVERQRDNPATIRCRTNHPTEKEILLKLIYKAF